MRLSARVIVLQCRKGGRFNRASVLSRCTAEKTGSSPRALSQERNVARKGVLAFDGNVSPYRMDKFFLRHHAPFARQEDQKSLCRFRK